MMFLVSVIWGVAGPVIKFTLNDFPPLIFLTYRFAISSTVALIYLSLTKERFPSTPKRLGAVFLYSILAVTLGLGLIFFGFEKTTSLTGSTLSSLAPLMMVVAGAIVLKEHVTKNERVGIAITFLGTLFLVASPLITNGKTQFEVFGRIEGNALLVFGHIIDVGGALLMKIILRHKISPAMLTHLSFIIGLLTIGALTFYVYSPQIIWQTITTASLTSHLGVWFMALFSGTLAYTLRNRAVKTIEVSEAAIFSYLYPLWAAPLALLWLGEKITPVFLLSAAVIAIGVVIAEYKRRQKKTKRHRRHRRRRMV